MSEKKPLGSWGSYKRANSYQPYPVTPAEQSQSAAEQDGKDAKARKRSRQQSQGY